MPTPVPTNSPAWKAIMAYFEATQVYSGALLPAAVTQTLAAAVTLEQCLACLQQAPPNSVSYKACERALSALMDCAPAHLQLLTQGLLAPHSRQASLKKLKEYPAQGLLQSDACLQALAGCMADPDTATATLAGHLLSSCAKLDLDAMRKVLQCLGGVPAPHSETFQLRVWELAAHLAADSPAACDACAGALAPLLAAAGSPQDPLVALNALQILQVLCHSEHGAALCCRTPAFVQGLLQSIHDPLVGDEALRMVGQLAAAAPDGLLDATLVLVQGKMAARGHDSLVGLQVFASLMASPRCLGRLDAPSRRLWMTRVAEHMRSGAETDRVVALDSACCAMRIGCPALVAASAAAAASTNSLLCEQLVDADMVEAAVTCLKSAHSKVQEAAFWFVRVLVCQDHSWGLKLVLGSRAIMQALLDERACHGPAANDARRLASVAASAHPQVSSLADAATVGSLARAARSAQVPSQARLAEPEAMML